LAFADRGACFSGPPLLTKQIVSVQEIKEQLAILPRKEQDEVMAFLFHLRHRDDPDYQCDVARRMGDKDTSHWLSPDDFERELDRKEQP